MYLKLLLSLALANFLHFLPEVIFTFSFIHYVDLNASSPVNVIDSSHLHEYGQTLVVAKVVNNHSNTFRSYKPKIS